ncbi:hypothetical protein M6D81_04415 [Paenibacillus sp. J5C_2022]|uniref:hypothetical protein n=1 Tax=Paenibacillus sp. J5C2022 TaxID=2977129 RepID=UPI0021D20AAF|nr:hypothetical protein [Paenibacillus sp. J5C2022]MCU6707949.1 hypothetical protein [Paenibacillus sp. J5C2022]
MKRSKYARRSDYILLIFIMFIISVYAIPRVFELLIQSSEGDYKSKEGYYAKMLYMDKGGWQSEGGQYSGLEHLLGAALQNHRIVQEIKVSDESRVCVAIKETEAELRDVHVIGIASTVFERFPDVEYVTIIDLTTESDAGIDNERYTVSRSLFETVVNDATLTSKEQFQRMVIPNT